ncbi:helix-turn-helix domain-containing protein [Actinoallomurus rhizosphaericola]|uniref:helix-turn-helix domain-containing protein n=1 Tax=Actinoallomurus rhizosphaericola TaxID=2952536 RepID=UPI00209191B5|nr:helix-turn-helix domain-containing protein [Actinoallomurus rhizosphaericola]MCO5994379.1 helix-turn-helix domain-containing protein [Actinoallomurus rhizosphaericola]
MDAEFAAANLLRPEDLQAVASSIQRIDDLPDGWGLHLADALASLLVASFTDTGPRRVEMAADLTDRIIAYALANLNDPALSVDSVARRHGISSRYLHRLFQRRGTTFAAWVRRERLIRIRRDLQDPALVTRTAAAIAARWGIRDAGHLSRALKREFGRTAADIRREASPGRGGPGRAGREGLSRT